MQQKEPVIGESNWTVRIAIETNVQGMIKIMRFKCERLKKENNTERDMQSNWQLIRFKICNRLIYWDLVTSFWIVRCNKKNHGAEELWKTIVLRFTTHTDYELFALRMKRRRRRRQKNKKNGAHATKVIGRLYNLLWINIWHLNENIVKSKLIAECGNSLLNLQTSSLLGFNVNFFLRFIHTCLTNRLFYLFKYLAYLPGVLSHQSINRLSTFFVCYLFDFNTVNVCWWWWWSQKRALETKH